MKSLRLLLPEAAAAAAAAAPAAAAAGRGWGWIRSPSSSSSSSSSSVTRGRKTTTTTTTPTPRLPFLRPINCSSVSSSTRAPPAMAEPSELRPELVSRSSVDAKSLEERIEKVIYAGRFMTFLAIVGSLMGSILCFLKGCEYVMNSFTENFMSGGKVILMLVEAIDFQGRLRWPQLKLLLEEKFGKPEKPGVNQHSYNDMIYSFNDMVEDIYLVGTVMLVFGMGLYELFISNLDIAKTSAHRSNLFGLFRLRERPNWLKIESVNELKTKLGHVIVTVLLVGLFEKSKKVTISSPNDLFCFAASILLSSGCLYLLSRLHT